MAVDNRCAGGNDSQDSASQNYRIPGLEALAASALDPLFWNATRMDRDSAWFAHIPFANWIVEAARPRVLVELGPVAPKARQRGRCMNPLREPMPRTMSYCRNLLTA